MALRLLLRGAMAADAERFAGQLRQAVPAPFPVIRSAERKARLDAFLERSSTRRVIAAETHTPQPDARRIEIATRLDVINYRLHRRLVIAADRKIVLALALPRAIEHQGRDPAIEIGPLIGLRLFFRGIETDRHDQHRRLRDAARQ